MRCLISWCESDAIDSYPVLDRQPCPRTPETYVSAKGADAKTHAADAETHCGRRAGGNARGKVVWEVGNLVVQNAESCQRLASGDTLISSLAMKHAATITGLVFLLP
jgi:hypothetical protein